MPANMMMAEVGSDPNVSGNNSAIADEGPIPGSAPTSWPTKTPAKHMRRCQGVSALAKPVASSAKADIQKLHGPRGNGTPSQVRKTRISAADVAADTKSPGITEMRSTTQ